MEASEASDYVPPALQVTKSASGPLAVPIPAEPSSQDSLISRLLAPAQKTKCPLEKQPRVVCSPSAHIPASCFLLLLQHPDKQMMWSEGSASLCHGLPAPTLSRNCDEFKQISYINFCGGTVFLHDLITWFNLHKTLNTRLHEGCTLTFPRAALEKSAISGRLPQ